MANLDMTDKQIQKDVFTGQCNVNAIHNVCF